MLYCAFFNIEFSKKNNQAVKRFKNQKTNATAFHAKQGLSQFAQRVFLITSACFFASPAMAIETAQIETLTQQWLDIEKQTAQLQRSWKEQQPTLKQQLFLLKEEKAQLEQMLNADTSSQEQVEIKRSELLADQTKLEIQQDILSDKLNVLNKQLLQISDLLPPPLISAWQDEEQALGAEPTASLQLQVGLAKLAKLTEFNQRLSVHEMPITSPNGNEILVKQFYLGASNAWFSSANGEYKGWGQASSSGWQWHFDPQLNADTVKDAIAIFEKKKQADFVSLPITLQPSLQAALKTLNSLPANSQSTGDTL